MGKRGGRGGGEWDGIPKFFYTLLAFWILWARKSFSLQWNGLSWPRATLRRVHWCEQASDQPYIGPPHQITRPENQKDCGARKHFVSVGLSTFSTIFLGLLWLLASYRGAFFIFILVYFSAHDFIFFIFWDNLGMEEPSILDYYNSHLHKSENLYLYCILSLVSNPVWIQFEMKGYFWSYKGAIKCQRSFSLPLHVHICTCTYVKTACDVLILIDTCPFQRFKGQSEGFTVECRLLSSDQYCFHQQQVLLLTFWRLLERSLWRVETADPTLSCFKTISPIRSSPILLLLKSLSLFHNFALALKL